MPGKTDAIITDYPCPRCNRKLHQCWIVGGRKPPRLADGLHCPHCDMDYPKPMA